MGPGRYRGCCRDTVANSDAESYAITNGVTSRMRAGKSNTYAYADGNTYRLAGLHAAVHDNSDRGQHRTGHNGHWQSRG